MLFFVAEHQSGRQSELITAQPGISKYVDKLLPHVQGVLPDSPNRFISNLPFALIQKNAALHPIKLQILRIIEPERILWSVERVDF